MSSSEGEAAMLEQIEFGLSEPTPMIELPTEQAAPAAIETETTSENPLPL
jgi:hypothetical protein